MGSNMDAFVGNGVCGWFLAALPIQQGSAFEAGQWTARAVMVLLPLLALIWCGFRFRRPAVNRKCVLSLVLVLVALLLGGLLSVSDAVLRQPQTILLLKTGVALTILALLLAGFIIGILGMLECQDRRRAYKQGPGFAVAALVVAGVSVTAILAAGPGMFTLPVRFFEKRIPTGEPGPPIAVDDFNFRLRTPGTPWTAAEKSPLHPRSQLTFTRKSPDMALAVVADKLGPGFSTDQLLEVGKANTRKLYNSGQIVLEKPEVFNGLEGIRVETHGLSRSSDVLCVQWYCFTNGFAYQLLAEGPWRSRKVVSEEAGRLFSLFECIDFDRLTDEGGLSFQTNYVSPHYSYQVDVVNSGWRQWRALQRGFSWFEFAARQESGVYMAVVPAWLGEEIDEEAVRGAMLMTMGIEYPDPALTERKTLQYPGVTGVQFDFEREVYDVPYRYRLRILHGGGYAWLLAVWMEKHKPGYDEAFDAALARVNCKPGSGQPPDTSTFNQAEKAARALVLNQAGAYYYRQEKYARARPLFVESYAMSPEALAFENALMAWSHLDEPADALAFIEKELTKYPQSARLRSYQALFQGRAGKRQEAVATYEKLFAEGAVNLEWFDNYIWLLVGLERYDDALKAVREQLKSADTTELRLLEAIIYREKKDFPEAIRLLKELRRKTPFVSEVGQALVTTYIGAGDFEAARQVANEMLQSGQMDWSTYLLKARCEVELKLFDDAVESYEKALRLAPNQPEIKKGLEAVSALAGRGSNSTVKEPIAPVRIPEALMTSTPSTVPADYGKDYGAYYARRITALQLERDGSSKRTDYGRVKILDASGAAAFSTVTVPFDPLNEEIFVNEVRVIESGGTVVTGKVSRFYVTDDLGSELVTHQKVLNVPVSGLAPGSVLEFTYTVKQSGNQDESPFTQLILSRGFPVRESTVFVTGETSRLKWKASQGIEPQKLPEGLCWVCKDPPIGRREPLQPAPAEFLSMLWLGTGSPQWPTLANRYLEMISDRMRLDPTLRDWARELAEGLTGATAKMRVLARYVQTNYTYKGLEFGRRGMVPEMPSEMARNKYGDCKDHSVMLQQLLEAVGVPARLALVNSQGNVQKALPSLDQFDHMIVFVPGQGTNSFIDCTQKGALLGWGPPQGLEGNDALILDPTEPRFERIPGIPANPPAIHSERRITIVNREDALVQETLSFTGSLAANLREALLETPVTGRRLFLQNQLGEGKADLSEWSIEELENPELPLKFKLAYRVRQQFHYVEGRIVGALPSLVERTHLLYEQLDKRQSPVEIKQPVHFTSDVQLVVPAGFTAKTTANTDQTLDEPFLTARRHEESSDAELRLRFEFAQKPGIFPAQQYAALREAHAEALLLVERRLSLQQAN